MARGVPWVVAGIVVLATAGIGLALVDPSVARPGAPTVDAGAPPPELVAAAVAQTRHRDHAVTIHSEVTGADDRIGLDYRIRIDATDRQYLVRGLDNPTLRYANAHRSWEAIESPAGPDDWRAEGRQWTPLPVDGPHDLGDANVSTVRSNASVVVLRVDGVGTVHRLFFDGPRASARGPGHRAHARIVLDRRVGAPSRITVVESFPSSSRSRRRTTPGRASGAGR